VCGSVKQLVGKVEETEEREDAHYYHGNESEYGAK